MSDEIKIQIIMYCQDIKCGTKPVAMIPIQVRYIEKVKEYVLSDGLNIYVKEEEDSNWKTIFIYKYDFLLDVIKEAPEHPNSIFEHWTLGKLFGYSDEAIKDFLITLYGM